MIRTARIFPPLVALAMASLLAVANPSSPHAQVMTAPIAAPAAQPEPVVIDLVERMLTELRDRAILVGRVGNLAYVQISMDRGFFIRAQPNGQVRISQATGAAIRAFANVNGWRV